jgi:hypothetical protein
MRHSCWPRPARGAARAGLARQLQRDAHVLAHQRQLERVVEGAVEDALVVVVCVIQLPPVLSFSTSTMACRVQPVALAGHQGLAGGG